MSQTLRIPNFSRELNILAQTTISQAAAAAASSLSVTNCAAFTTGSLVLVGAPGSNSAELNTAGTLSSDTTLPLASTTKLPHSPGEVASMLFGNQLKIYSAPDIGNTGIAPPDNTFTLLTTINIDPTMAYTTYTDSAGGSTTWYKFTYFNSTSSAGTAIADSVATRGDTGLNYCSLDEIRNKAGFKNNNNIGDGLIDEKRQAAQTVINGALLPVYVFPLPQPTNPIIAELARNLAASYLTQDVYRTTNAQMLAQGEKDEQDALTDLNDLVVKEVVITNAQFVDQVIPGGNGVSGYPDNTLGPPNVAGEGGYESFQQQGGPPQSIFYPGKVY